MLFFVTELNVNNNSILGGAAAVIVIGLITYIAINKRIAD